MESCHQAIAWTTETFSYYSRSYDDTQYELFHDQRFRAPRGSRGYNKKQSPRERITNSKDDLKS